MKTFNLSWNPFSIVLIQIAIMGAAYLISFQKLPESHLLIEVFVLAVFWSFTQNLNLHSIAVSERFAPLFIVFFLLLVLISLINNFNYYYFASNPMWFPLAVLVLSLIFQFKNSRYSLVIIVLSFSLILYSGSREFMLWFVFLHFIKSTVENNRIPTMHKFGVMFFILATLLVAQYTFRTSSSDFSLSELKTSIERTTKRIAFPIFVSNAVFDSGNEMKSQFGVSDFVHFLIPSAISNHQKIVPGQQIQHIYFNKESSVNLPVTFAGQAKHYFGSYWSVGMVIFLIVLFLVFTIIRGFHNNQVSVPFYLITLFFMFRYDHGIYIINNILKILPLVLITIYILEKTSLVKKVKNLTY